MKKCVKIPIHRVKCFNLQVIYLILIFSSFSFQVDYAGAAEPALNVETQKRLQKLVKNAIRIMSKEELANARNDLATNIMTKNKLRNVVYTKLLSVQKQVSTLKARHSQGTRPEWVTYKINSLERDIGYKYTKIKKLGLDIEKGNYIVDLVTRFGDIPGSRGFKTVIPEVFNFVAEREIPSVLYILGRNFDSTNTSFTINITAPPKSGSAVVMNDGQTIGYTPNYGFIGTDSLIFTIDNDNGHKATANVTIKVVCTTCPTLTLEDRNQYRVLRLSWRQTNPSKIAEFEVFRSSSRDTKKMTPLKNLVANNVALEGRPGFFAAEYFVGYELELDTGDQICMRLKSIPIDVTKEISNLSEASCIVIPESVT